MRSSSLNSPGCGRGIDSGQRILGDVRNEEVEKLDVALMKQLAEMELKFLKEL